MLFLLGEPVGKYLKHLGVKFYTPVWGHSPENAEWRSQQLTLCPWALGSLVFQPSSDWQWPLRWSVWDRFSLPMWLRPGNCPLIPTASSLPHVHASLSHTETLRWCIGKIKQLERQSSVTKGTERNGEKTIWGYLVLSLCKFSNGKKDSRAARLESLVSHCCIHHGLTMSPSSSLRVRGGNRKTQSKSRPRWAAPHGCTFATAETTSLVCSWGPSIPQRFPGQTHAFYARHSWLFHSVSLNWEISRREENLLLLLSESETPLDAQCQKSIPDYITTSEIEENDSTI